MPGAAPPGIKVANINHKGDVSSLPFMPQVVVATGGRDPSGTIWMTTQARAAGAEGDQTHHEGACGKCDYLEMCEGAAEGLLPSGRSACRGPDVHTDGHMG